MAEGKMLMICLGLVMLVQAIASEPLPPASVSAPVAQAPAEPSESQGKALDNLKTHLQAAVSTTGKHSKALFNEIRPTVNQIGGDLMEGAKEIRAHPRVAKVEKAVLPRLESFRDASTTVAKKVKGRLANRRGQTNPAPTPAAAPVVQPEQQAVPAVAAPVQSAENVVANPAPEQAAAAAPYNPPAPGQVN